MAVVPWHTSVNIGAAEQQGAIVRCHSKSLDRLS